VRTVAAVVVAALLTAATACGGGGGSDTRAAKRVISRDAQQQAESINLKLSDLPDGWRASTPSSSDAASQKKFRKCIGADFSKVTLMGDASSKDFAKGENATTSSQAQITETASQAMDGMRRLSRALSSAATKDCVRAAIGSTPGFKVGEVDVGELKFTPPTNVDSAKAWEIVVPLEGTSGTANGLSVSVYGDFVYLRKGNVVASVSTGDVFSPLGEVLRAHLVRTVASRMSEPS
jgi:hypothetical protein